MIVHPCLRRCQCVAWRRQDVAWALSRTQHARTSLMTGTTQPSGRALKEQRAQRWSMRQPGVQLQIAERQMQMQSVKRQSGQQRLQRWRWLQRWRGAQRLSSSCDGERRIDSKYHYSHTATLHTVLHTLLHTYRV